VVLRFVLRVLRLALSEWLLHATVWIALPGADVEILRASLSDALRMTGVDGSRLKTPTRRDGVCGTLRVTCFRLIWSIIVDSVFLPRAQEWPSSY
jgi:hypothetical protein